MGWKKKLPGVTGLTLQWGWADNGVMFAASRIVAIKAIFDGHQIVLPDEVRGLSPGNVIVLFMEDAGGTEDRTQWMKVQESAFTKTWDNPEDEIYDQIAPD